MCVFIQEKIKHVPISVFFDDYSGDGNDFESSHQHIKSHFVALNNQEDKDVYTHVSTKKGAPQGNGLFFSQQSIAITALLTSVNLSFLITRLRKFIPSLIQILQISH